MTTTGDPGPSTTTVLRRAVGAEWTRLWSVRSTWWCLLAGIAIMFLMATAFGLDTRGDPERIPVWLAAEFAIIPAQFAFLLISILTVTAEYSNGAIRSSLQWVPRRGVLFVARSLVAVTVATASALLVAVATDAIAWAWLGGALGDIGDIGRSLGAVALYVALGSLFSIGLAWLTRNTAGALMTVFLLLLVLPLILPGFGVQLLTTIAERLPGYANVSLLEGLGLEPGIGLVVWVLAGWIGAALIAGSWSLLRRDAA